MTAKKDRVWIARDGDETIKIFHGTPFYHKDITTWADDGKRLFVYNDCPFYKSLSDIFDKIKPGQCKQFKLVEVKKK